jgi:hypothetical protein
MNMNRKIHSPDRADEMSGTPTDGTSADERSITNEHERDWRGEEDTDTAGHLTSTKLDAKEDGGDQANVRGGDSTILGAGGGAGGLSGDGERTDEYDAAVMGLDD